MGHGIAAPFRAAHRRADEHADAPELSHDLTLLAVAGVAQAGKPSMRCNSPWTGIVLVRVKPPAA
jgi:hypothetical protein